MANGMYSTPLMGTGIVANPMQLQRNAMLMGTTMPTTPQVSTVMPPPPMQPATQTPQVSTVMPTGTKVKENMRSIISTNPQFFDVILVDEDTPNLKEILTFSTYDSQYGITLYKGR